jgi:hypothetical protein
MKSIKYIVSSFLLVACLASCSEDDNYPVPAETFRGTIVDAETGEPFQTDVYAVNGTSGVRIKLMEYSWSDTPLPYYFYTKNDGTFNNTKIFKGEYGVTPEGAFVALPEERMQIAGTVEKNYEVDPFLRVTWAGEPVVNADGTVTIQVKIDRGTNHPDYQQALTEVWFYVSEVELTGGTSFNSIYSTRLSGGQLPALGATVSITSGWGINGPSADPTKKPTALPNYSRKFFLRVGARTARQVNAQNVFNFTNIQEVTTN